jgi:hypothetical protein
MKECLYNKLIEVDREKGKKVCFCDRKKKILFGIKQSERN